MAAAAVANNFRIPRKPQGASEDSSEAPFPVSHDKRQMD
ncbi:hypothetical protein CLOLEP_00539 [[Clostridium] leptum DSM 753]|uniref:Uncharacterized protein n=1 Tax=[Clostridium] leptum DSM 753 TaxID=428125 RepID=A7VPR2_9FIRM|nr:hypothetical protein CLOLEP_00539 [[Clostridium] leptum DSM 753]